MCLVLKFDVTKRIKDLCFNISLSQFFAEDESVALMTFPQKEYLARWETLTQENRMCVDKFIDFLKAKQSETDR